MAQYSHSITLRRMAAAILKKIDIT